ncbi:MAG: hypothetical protein MK213_10175 [Planctomycetes bacterium]|nr:hypothetical protein [Planctomycetota bacterium]
MKRFRLLAILGLALLTFGLGSCARPIQDDLSQKGQVMVRDANSMYDTFSKVFMNHDPDDPYLD